MKNSEIHSILKEIYRLSKSKKFHAALENIKQLLRVRKGHLYFDSIERVHYYLLGKVDPESGLIHIQKLLVDDPYNVDLLLTYGVILDREQHLHEESIVFLEKNFPVNTHYTDHSLYLRDCARVYNAIAISHSHIPSHLALFGKVSELAVKVDPTFGRAWSTRGKYLELVGREKEAKECFQKAFDLDSNQKRWLDRHTPYDTKQTEVKALEPKEDFLPREDSSSSSKVGKPKHVVETKKATLSVSQGTSAMMMTLMDNTPKKKTPPRKLERAQSVPLIKNPIALENVFDVLKTGEERKEEMQLDDASSHKEEARYTSRTRPKSTPKMLRAKSAPQLHIPPPRAEEPTLAENHPPSFLTKAGLFVERMTKRCKDEMGKISVVSSLFTSCRRRRAHVEMIKRNQLHHGIRAKI